MRRTQEENVVTLVLLGHYPRLLRVGIELAEGLLLARERGVGVVDGVLEQQRVAHVHGLRVLLHVALEKVVDEVLVQHCVECLQVGWIARNVEQVLGEGRREPQANVTRGTAQRVEHGLAKEDAQLSEQVRIERNAVGEWMWQRVAARRAQQEQRAARVGERCYERLGHEVTQLAAQAVAIDAVLADKVHGDAHVRECLRRLALKEAHNVLQDVRASYRDADACATRQRRNAGLLEYLL